MAKNDGKANRGRVNESQATYRVGKKAREASAARAMRRLARLRAELTRTKSDDKDVVTLVREERER